jgi:hypothetical protein
MWHPLCIFLRGIVVLLTQDYVKHLTACRQKGVPMLVFLGFIVGLALLICVAAYIVLEDDVTIKNPHKKPLHGNGSGRKR